MVKSIETIKKLDLRGNGVRNKGATGLALAIKSHPSIFWLDLSDNHISLHGAIALLEAVMSNRNVLHLDLSGNPIDFELLATIDLALKQNQKKAQSRV